MDIDSTAQLVIGSAIRIHRQLGPGLLESAYELMLASDLIRRGATIERQKRIDIVFDGMAINNAFVLDLLVNNHLIVELKATEKDSPLFSRQMLTYLRLTNLQVGLILNFGQETLKDGLHRIVNNYRPPSSVLGASA